MIPFEKTTLDNGLVVLVHRDEVTPLVAVNLLYKVGARDEDPSRTGFAHLFEHLMFGGSAHIPVFDEPLERVGGQNNAFTNNDYTNYYLQVPRQNLETAFWLESDRLFGLSLSEKSIEVQKNVVKEEFKQRYLNQPYGDIWLLIRPLAYKVHPYRWPTIGMDLSHIEEARPDDVAAFFEKHYCPGNAILSVTGKVDPQEVFSLADRWFGSIERPYTHQRRFPAEPPQLEERQQIVHRDVPFDAVYQVFHMSKRDDPRYYAADLISDILSNGESSRFQRTLIREKRLFSEVSAFVGGELDEGIFIIGGKLVKGVSPEKGIGAIGELLTALAEKKVDARELQKVKNKVEVALRYGEMKVLDKAMNLAYFEMMGNASRVNEEIDYYQRVDDEALRQEAGRLFTRENTSTLFYLANGV